MEFVRVTATTQWVVLDNLLAFDTCQLERVQVDDDQMHVTLFFKSGGFNHLPYTGGVVEFVKDWFRLAERRYGVQETKTS